MPTAPELKRKSPVVLIVDDDPSTRALLQLVLERADFSTVQAVSGIQAIDQAKQIRPDVLVLDILIPDMSGLRVIEMLRASPETSHIPILCLTAVAPGPHDAARALKLGANDYVRKPFDPDELIARLSVLIRKDHTTADRHGNAQILSALVALSESLNSATSIASVADNLLGFLISHTSAEHAALAIRSSNELVNSSSLWIRDQHVSRALPRPPADVRSALDTNGRTMLSMALSSATPLSIDDTTTGGLLGIIPGTLARSGIANALTNRGQVIGALVLAGAKVAQFDPDDLLLLRTVAAQATPIISQLMSKAPNLYKPTAPLPALTAPLVSQPVDSMPRGQNEQVEKMAAIGTLMAGIAHEINNPLQSVLISLQVTRELLVDGQPVDPKMLELAEQEVRRLQRLSSRLLDMARPDRQQSSNFDLNDLVRDVLSLTTKQLQRGEVRVSTDLAPLPTIYGNVDQIKQVILNLVINGLQAMPNGGMISLRTARKDGRVSLIVEDTGTGIPLENLPHIFDPFFTTKENGTGLGLPLSQQIIQKHGGQIEAQSALGQGTTLTIWLPVTQQPEKAAANNKSA